jgi:hypothetical protein
LRFKLREKLKLLDYLALILTSPLSKLLNIIRLVLRENSFFVSLKKLLVYPIVNILIANGLSFLAMPA